MDSICKSINSAINASNIYPHFHSSIHSSVHMSIDQSNHPSLVSPTQTSSILQLIYSFVCLSICPHIFCSIHSSSIHLTIHFFHSLVRPSNVLSFDSIHLLIHQSFHLSIHSNVCRLFHIFIHLFTHPTKKLLKNKYLS